MAHPPLRISDSIPSDCVERAGQLVDSGEREARAYPRRPGGDEVLHSVVDQRRARGVENRRIEDMLEEAKARLALREVGRGVDVLEEAPNFWLHLAPEHVPLRARHVRHPDDAHARVLLQVAQEVEHGVVEAHGPARTLQRTREVGFEHRELGGDELDALFLRDVALLVLEPDGRGEDAAQELRADGGHRVRRPGEQHAAEVDNDAVARPVAIDG